MKYYNLKLYGVTHKVTPILHKYASNDRIAVELVTNEGESFATITVNLPDAFDTLDLPDNAAYLDDNNCPWAAKFVEDNNLGLVTSMQYPSGYCLYTLCLFDLDKITPYYKQTSIQDFGIKLNN